VAARGLEAPARILSWGVFFGRNLLTVARSAR
jgi:hypothetical protein